MVHQVKSLWLTHCWNTDMDRNIINIPTVVCKPTVTSCQQQYLFIFIGFSYYLICYVSMRKHQNNLPRKRSTFFSWQSFWDKRCGLFCPSSQIGGYNIFYSWGHYIVFCSFPQLAATKCLTRNFMRDLLFFVVFTDWNFKHFNRIINLVIKRKNDDEWNWCLRSPIQWCYFIKFYVQYILHPNC